jgi:hypothetical protein
LGAVHVAVLDGADDAVVPEADELAVDVAVEVEADGAAPAELATYSAAPPAARPPTATRPSTPARRWARCGDRSFGPTLISSGWLWSVTVGFLSTGGAAAGSAVDDTDPGSRT